MLRGRKALVVVFLCFVCLPNLKPQPDERLCNQDIPTRVKHLIDRAPQLKWLESRLYTPNITDYRKCPSSAIKCFAAEIKVLTDEWKTVTKLPRFQLNLLLAELATLFNETEVGCRQCELLNEQNAGEFLRCLLSTLQAINTDYCTSSWTFHTT